MSTAALGVVLWAMQPSSRLMTASRSITSIPTRAGRIYSRMAQRMDAVVSPVITAVGGASP